MFVPYGEWTSERLKERGGGVGGDNSCAEKNKLSGGTTKNLLNGTQKGKEVRGGERAVIRR